MPMRDTFVHEQRAFRPCVEMSLLTKLACLRACVLFLERMMSWLSSDLNAELKPCFLELVFLISNLFSIADYILTFWNETPPNQ